MGVGCFIIPLLFVNCSSNDNARQPSPEFYFGADLSYVNQILDHNGQYLDEGEIRDPYQIFAEHGTNLARFRLWHNPVWTKEVYGEEGTQLYNDLPDVEKSIRKAKEQGMSVLLDFHYSDTWADPGKQHIPAAWLEVRDIEVMADSVYNYTYNVLTDLATGELMPEFVQVGNETNCGMLYTDAPDGFPPCNVCNGNWANLGLIFNRAIQAIKDVEPNTKIVLHVADPKHVNWWFENITENGGVNDFDIIGFSYYPIWHTSIPVSSLSIVIEDFRTKFDKDVMILETAYPWSASGIDGYGNIFGSGSALDDYPFTVEGQYGIVTTMTQEVIDGGGLGIIYWEPAWISSDLRDLWGKGSSWENNTFFDFTGNAHEVIDYPEHEYIYPDSE